VDWASRESASAEQSSAISSDLSRFERAYAHAFILALAICWSPIKPLAYVAPWIILSWIILMGGSGRTAQRTLLVLALWMGNIGLRALLSERFVFASAILTTVTYGTLIFFLAVPRAGLHRDALLRHMFRPLPALVVIEAIYGIAQAFFGYVQGGSFDLSNGDRVQGTIFPFFYAENAFSNPMYTVNLTFLLLVMLLLGLTTKRGATPLVLGGLALVLASVVHVLLFFALSLAVAFLVFRPPLPKRALSVVLIVGAVAAPLLAVTVLQRNFRNLPKFAVGMYQGEYPRAEAMVRVATRLVPESPEISVVGLGPGQFTSRASLIGTGYYFGGIFSPRPLPLLPTGMSEEFRRYMLDLWVQSQATPWLGSTHQPFFSWMSVFTEFGILPVIVVVWVGVVLVRHTRLTARTNRDRLLATAVLAGFSFLLLLGMQENYWEVPQAILPGAMLLKAMHANLESSTRRRSERSGWEPSSRLGNVHNGRA